MSYVDGFVLPLPRKKAAAYRRMAAKAGKIWREHGALDFKECMLDDATVMAGIMPFPRFAKLKKGETLFFSFIVYKSRTHRDRVNAQVFKDKRMEKMTCPFDHKRMTYGGFKAVVEA